MATLPDLSTVAQAFIRAGIVIDQSSCLLARNKQTSCRRCVDICPEGALSVKQGAIALDATRCVSCGACIGVCPMAAISAVDPSVTQVEQALRKAQRITGDMAVIACSRKAAAQEADPDSFVEVPCLARLDESLLVELAASGFTSIILVDGDCSSCKYGKVNDAINVTVKMAQTLLEATKATCALKRDTVFPPSLRVEAGQKRGVARRSFFRDTKQAAQSLANIAAQEALDELSRRSGQMVGSGAGQGLTQRTSPLEPVFATRNLSVLDAMDELGPDEEASVDTRLFGSVSLDREACSGCGFCVLYCPTQALRYQGQADPTKDFRAVDFSAADCVQCHLCEDVCLPRALKIDSDVAVSELFDFEPRTLAMAKPKRHGQDILSRFR